MAKRSNAVPTRLNKYGFSQQLNTKTDPYIEAIVIPITVVASTDAQLTSIFLPFRAQVTSAVINVLTAEVTGTLKEVTVGVVGGADDAIMGITPVGGVGFKGTATLFNGGAQEITYTLGGANFVELKAEIVIQYTGSDE